MEWGMISGKKSQLWNFICTVLCHLLRGFPSSSISRLWCYAQFHIHSVGRRIETPITETPSYFVEVGKGSQI